MRTITALSIGLALMVAGSAFARTSVSIGVGFNVPPPPVVVYREEPRWVYVPRERVYVVDDDDLDYDYFRYGGMYYIYDHDNWYRSRSYRGPFIAVRAGYVPEPIWAMSYDDGYRWRHQPHGMPTWLAKKFSNKHWNEGKHKHGHGHGHDHDDD